MPKSPIRNLTRCALCTALLCLCGWLTIPLPGISLTMQTFGVFLTLLLLGGGRGSLTVLLYLLLGCAGLPVFSGFQGGIGILLGPTGGYLWGFLAASLIFWLAESRLAPPYSMTLSLLSCYACGTLWYAYGYLDGTGSLMPILAQCVLPYLLPDCLKLWLAYRVSKRLQPILR